MTDKHDDLAREIIKNSESWAALKHNIASALRQVERETLERAAKVCDTYAESHATGTAIDVDGENDRKAQAWMMIQCAARIRALIASEKVQEGG